MRFLRLLCVVLALSFAVSSFAAAADIQKALVIVFGHEGGYVNDPHDPGGETKYGICKRIYPREDIRHLTLQRAAQLYKRDYWDPLRLGDLKSQGIATEIFDTAVNCGVGTAAIICEKTCNMLNGNGRDYPLDARITPETVRWINDYTRPRLQRKTFWKLLNAFQLQRYLAITERDPRRERYLKSWLSRVWE